MTNIEKPADRKRGSRQKKQDQVEEQTSSDSKAWYVYMVRCNDNTLYTGITTNVVRRLSEHNGDDFTETDKQNNTVKPVDSNGDGQAKLDTQATKKGSGTSTATNNSSSMRAKATLSTRRGKGASYTSARRPVTLVYTTRVANRSVASQQEWKIKRMSRRAKEALLSAVVE